MNAKKLEHFLFVPLQPWRHRSDHNRNLGFPVAQHHTWSKGRRRRRGGSHAGGACPADMTGGGGGLRPQSRRPTCAHWLSSP